VKKGWLNNEGMTGRKMIIVTNCVVITFPLDENDNDVCDIIEEESIVCEEELRGK